MAEVRSGHDAGAGRERHLVNEDATPDAAQGFGGIEVRGVNKSFAGRPVLTDVNVDLLPGEVHALVGANGAGKSTLVKLLSGNLAPDAGIISIKGQPFSGMASPLQATELGIRVVHQETPLFDTLSVAESVGLFRGYPIGFAGRVRWRTLQRRARAMLEGFGIAISPRTLGGRLSAAERALVSVAMVLGDVDPSTTSLLILDEASAAVPKQDAEQFLMLVRKLAEAGTPVLMVTHRLGEVEAVADRVTVLSDGRVVYQGVPPSRDRLVTLITGSEFEPQSGASERAGNSGVPSPRQRTNVAALSVTGLVGGTLKGLDFTLGQGECIGFVGPPDSGIEDLPLALIGAIDRGDGRFMIDGVAVRYPEGPGAALRAGVALVPRDRAHQGGIGSLSMTENLLLPVTQRYWHRPGRARAVVAAMIQELDIRPPVPNILLRELSGGNQQKVIVGKWLNCRPRVLILDDPTVGVDPGARRRLFDVLAQRARDEDLAVILMTSEPEQLVEHCDRVLAMGDGRIVQELKGRDINYVEVAKWASA